MEQGIGMRLTLDGKRSLTIGGADLVLNEPGSKSRSSCAGGVSGSGGKQPIPLYNVLWAELSNGEIRIDYAAQPSKSTFVRKTWKSKVATPAADSGEPTPEAFVSMLQSRAYSDAQPKKRAYVLVNPNAGPGKATSQWQNEVKPLFEAARMHVDSVILKKGGEAVDLVEKVDIDKYDTIMACSGDGTVHEIFNGLGKRPDAQRALRKIAVSHIPCGSGNAMSCNLYGSHHPSVAALGIIKGVVTPMDLASVTQGDRRILSFLSQSLGIIAESDLGTENMRWMGSSRFDVGVLMRVFQRKCYPCDVAIKVDIEGKAEIKSHFKRHRAQQHSESLARFNKEEINEGESLPPLKYGTVNDELPSGWQLVPYDNVGNFYCGNMAWMAPKANFFPAALASDGHMDLVTINGDLPIVAAAKTLLAVESGKFFDNANVTYRKISAYRIIPRDQKDGYISIDDICLLAYRWHFLAMRNRGGRAASGPWGRLKPPEQDYLESIGLPSKGDTRLLDKKTQEKYYTKITERYMSFCSKAGHGDELLRRFSSLQGDGGAQATNAKQTDAYTAPANSRDLTIILMALRKLREGIVASKRADEFSNQAYLFCIRTSVLVKQHEAYHPAILHLLRAMHPQHPLTSVEVQEVVGFLVLDTACRRGDLAEAYAIRQQYRLRDTKLDAALSALTHDNYVAFERVRRSVDGHRARIMEWAQGTIRMHALKCFGRTYLSVDREFLEKATGSKWDDLRHDNGVGWELDGNKVVIRKVKARCELAEHIALRVVSSNIFFFSSHRSLCHTRVLILLVTSNMAPPKKKAKASHDDKPSMLLADFRTAWLVKYAPLVPSLRPCAKDDQSVEIKAGDEVFIVHRHVLTKHSEYFGACLKKAYVEGDGFIQFNDIDPKYLGFFIGVAYSYSSIIPHTVLSPAETPEASLPKTPLRDFVEVLKLCDRFVCKEMGKFIKKCVETSIGNGHRALFRSPLDEKQQLLLMKDFADAFEALDQAHPVQKELGMTLIQYFCGGISYHAWDKLAESIKDRPYFVNEVSRGFARILRSLELAGRKLRRKELPVPSTS
ncbi:putative sphingolipid long chain base kinase [Paramyrothecium foliicola]|nr:putative sphingolipid long chain base kinase [Paramyrothecium foliicola]